MLSVKGVNLVEVVGGSGVVGVKGDVTSNVPCFVSGVCCCGKD